ncbi:hypothetical protein BDV95DRAFT_571777 [Massariosphaeria phaeospora]|uniref:Uncharacterized protein n=1 Tax=Massariosphaeria phaeospora TaxID=100035 RepID=A0A7C8IAD5_9PLEO|nr:hypothetical protein BDV95DRAFT_571777 [Massariosphaeria phaeospora]
MQSTAASRRAFSVLASKIHPQLPLSPRESQQLLNLLTTSFRSHLDREHPVVAPQVSRHKLRKTQPGRNASPTRLGSSHGLASQHIDSILTNPLFAVRPRHTISSSAPRRVDDVLKDPLGWFVDQIASGAADVSKATMCVALMQTNMKRSRITPNMHQTPDSGARNPGSLIANWLRSSGLDTSTEFVRRINDTEGLLHMLIPMLLEEGGEALVWRWFTYHPDQRVQETGLDASEIHRFRSQLLKLIVRSKMNGTSNLDEALATFLRAYKLVGAAEYKLNHKVLQAASSMLLQHFMAHSQVQVSPALYDIFIQSSKDWSWTWPGLATSILWLHHPSTPTAAPGLTFIKDLQKTIIQARTKIVKKPKSYVMVQLCLGVAHQLVAGEYFTDAQVAMDFAKDHYPDLVSPQAVAKGCVTRVHANQRADQKHRQVQENLELLDRLIPT